jgi:hypothetical protein
MRQISSSATVFYKRVFPAIWFGFIGLIFFGSLVGALKDGSGFGSSLFPLGMAAFGFIIMKIFVWDLVDEVWDDGDSLVVRNNGREARVDLLNIININHSIFTNPPRVSLTLRAPCEFGRIVKFSPPKRFFRFSEHPVVAELVERIDQKRQIAQQSPTPDATRK